MAEDAEHARDGAWHLKSYTAIMKWSAEVGVPFCLAAAMFFTNLTLAHGVWIAGAAGLVTFILAQWVVRTFFTH